jgi:hypothetical protein
MIISIFTASVAANFRRIQIHCYGIYLGSPTSEVRYAAILHYLNAMQSQSPDGVSQQSI